MSSGDKEHHHRVTICTLNPIVVSNCQRNIKSPFRTRELTVGGDRRSEVGDRKSGVGNCKWTTTANRQIPAAIGPRSDVGTVLRPLCGLVLGYMHVLLCLASHLCFSAHWAIPEIRGQMTEVRKGIKTDKTVRRKSSQIDPSQTAAMSGLIGQADVRTGLTG